MNKHLTISGFDITRETFDLRDYEETSGVFLDKLQQTIRDLIHEPVKEGNLAGKIWNEIRYRISLAQSKKTKYYRLSGAIGTAGASLLYDELDRGALQTVPLSKLKYVVNNVSNPARYFSLTLKEITFLPIWLMGRPQPQSVKQDSYIGNVLYTPHGVWYIQVDTERLRKAYLGSSWNKGFKDFNRINPEKDLEDSPLVLGLGKDDPGGVQAFYKAKAMFNKWPDKFDKEGGRHPVDVGFEYFKINMQTPSKFVKIPVKDYLSNISSLFQSWRTLKSKGVVPIYDMKVLDPTHTTDPEDMSHDPRSF